MLLFTSAKFLPPLKIGQDIVALTVSLSLSSTVALKSSVFEDSKDKVAEGENSAFAIVTSFSDCSYSSLDIIKSGLLFLEISIAWFKDEGTSKINS